MINLFTDENNYSNKCFYNLVIVVVKSASVRTIVPVFFGRVITLSALCRKLRKPRSRMSLFRDWTLVFHSQVDIEGVFGQPKLQHSNVGTCDFEYSDE